MYKYKNSVEQELCAGCAACEHDYDRFKPVDGKSNLINIGADDIGCNQQAADGCAVNAINLGGDLNVLLSM